LHDVFLKTKNIFSWLEKITFKIKKRKIMNKLKRKIRVKYLKISDGASY